MKKYSEMRIFRHRNRDIPRTAWNRSIGSKLIIYSTWGFLLSSCCRPTISSTGRCFPRDKSEFVPQLSFWSVPRLMSRLHQRGAGFQPIRSAKRPESPQAPANPRLPFGRVNAVPLRASEPMPCPWQRMPLFEGVLPEAAFREDPARNRAVFINGKPSEGVSPSLVTSGRKRREE